MKYADGDVYEGQFKLGLPSGPGTMFFNEGTKFTGDFAEGEPINY